MFTVLSNTRNSNLYLSVVLATMIVVILSFAVVPAISAPRPISIPVASSSEAASDYYQRHPELRFAGAAVPDLAGDFYLRHRQWTGIEQTAAIPVTGMSAEASDYFLRHPELNVSAANILNPAADFYLRHPDWTIAPVAVNSEASDYFQRHPELNLPAETTDLSDYFLRH